MPIPILMMETPESSSPAMIAAVTGAAPRYFGSSEKWQLTHPSGGSVSSSSFRNCPKATTAMTSGFHARICASASGEFTSSGVMHDVIPRSLAYARQGHGVTPRPRPAGRSGCVTTPTTFRPGSRKIAFRHMAEAADEPIKTIRMGEILPHPPNFV